MAVIIKGRNAIADPWRLLEPAADGTLPALPPAGDVIVPLALWQRERRLLLVRPTRIGVWLRGDDDPASIAGDLHLFGVVAVNFAGFTDGRGYSTARLLRTRYGYTGELRAVGDVLRDQIFYLSRCGFDAFALREGADPHAALAAFDDFSEAYQGAADRREPLFRRRGRAATGQP